MIKLPKRHALLFKFAFCFSMIFSLSAFFPSSFLAYAQQDPSSYDKYTEKLRAGSYTKEKDSWIEGLGNAPVVPVEVTKKGIEKALIVIEKTHLDKKVEYAWDKIHEWGFHPTGQQLHDHPQVGYNLLWDQSRLIKASPLAEHAGFTAWVGENIWNYYEVAAKPEVTNIFNTGLYVNQLFKYETRTREDFYGIGRNTSRGVSFTYRLEAMNYQTRFGREFKLPIGKLNVEGEYDFRDVRISGGRDGAKHPIRDFFKDDAALAGVNGGEYHALGINLMHDDRNDIEDPHWGGYRKFTVLFNEGVNGSNFDFTKFRFEAAQFFPVFKNGNVIAIRFAGEANDKWRGGDVPFFEMARLGGFANVRGLQYNRFFDNNMLWMSFEYRYNIWTFKNYKLDLVPEMDMGEVFGEGGDFMLSKLRFGYGGALRYKIKDRVNIDFEVAHSNEGTYYYVKYKAPF